MTQMPGISNGNSVYKVDGGKMIKISLAVDDAVIRDLRITGDFFVHPEDAVELLENKLAGTRIDDLAVNIDKEFAGNANVQLVGIGTVDIVHAVKLAQKNLHEILEK
jgi:hypothetical protein